MTSCSLWEMNMTDSPCSTALRRVSNKRVGLLRRQNGRRFVQDQDTRVTVKRFENLDALPFADRELPRSWRRDRHPRPKSCSELSQHVPLGGQAATDPIDQREDGTQKNILEYREVIRQA